MVDIGIWNDMDTIVNGVKLHQLKKLGGPTLYGIFTYVVYGSPYIYDIFTYKMLHDVTCTEY